MKIKHFIHRSNGYEHHLISIRGQEKELPWIEENLNLLVENYSNSNSLWRHNKEVIEESDFSGDRCIFIGRSRFSTPL